jgi:sialic acid synthase SpsE
MKETLISTGIFSLKAVKRLANIGFVLSSRAVLRGICFSSYATKSKVGQVAQLPDIGAKFNVRVR